MKKKLLFIILLLSSSINSINADFKQMFEGKMFSQFQKKQNPKRKKLDFSQFFHFIKINKPIDIQKPKNSDVSFIFKKNLIQNIVQNSNPFLLSFSRKSETVTLNKIAKLKKVSISGISPQTVDSSKVATMENKTNSSIVSNVTFAPDLHANHIDSQALNLFSIDSDAQNTVATEIISSSHKIMPPANDTISEFPTPTSENVLSSNNLVAESTNSYIIDSDSKLLDSKIIETLVNSNSVNLVSNDLIYKGDKETLKPNITSQHLNLLKEIKERAGKLETLSVSKKAVIDLDQVQEKLKNTVSGSLLDYNNPSDKTLENALSFKVKRMLSKIARDEKSKNKIASSNIIEALKDNRKGIEKEVTDLCREVLIKSAEYSGDYYTFYHGHGNGLRLYFDILREIKSFETIRNLDSTSPLRDKSSQSIGNTVEEILSNYEDKALDYAARNNQKLYDLSRGMGVGFAPDKIEYFRDHVISVNPNLFGNMNVLAECTLFYWLDSFNISNPNEALIKNLLTRIATHLPEDQVVARMAQYTELYNDFMKETGGNLMQIHVHKSIVDEISYASWMKGIPVLLDKDTHKLATRGSNSKPVPVLTDRENKYERPKTSDYLDLLTKDPNQFIEKYSDFSNRTVVKKHDLEECLDRPQARIVVNPNYFNDPDLVKVDHYTRFKPSDEALTNYQQKLKSFVQEDIDAYLKQLQSGSIKGQSSDRLTKLTNFIEEGTEFNFSIEKAKMTKISQIERDE